jgi:predicted permease
MRSWLQDLRFGLRLLRKGFVKNLLLILAVGVAIGACTAVFSIVDGLLLQPLDFRDPERLVVVSEQALASRSVVSSFASAGSFADWRRLARSFDGMAAGQNASYTLTSLEEPETPLVRRVTAGYFELLGVRPVLGRTFLAEEDRPGAKPVVLLSHSLWQRGFGGDPAVLGKSIELDETPHEIVGVLPPGHNNPLFRLDVPPQAWVPLALREAGLSRTERLYMVFARLKLEVSLEQAQEEMTHLAAAVAEQHPDTNEGIGARVTPAREVLVRNLRAALLVLFGAVLFVLLVTCANVANLLLARALTRRQELAVRRALGASLGRLLRQLALESLILSGLGGVLGLTLAYLALGPLLQLVPTGFNLPRLEHVAINGRVLLFTLGVTLLTGLGFGLVPAAQASGSRLHDSLAAGAARAIESRRSRRFRSALVVAEVGLSLVLLVGAGLMLQSFVSLQALHPGVEARGVLTFRVSVRGQRYATDEQRERFYREVLDGLAALPGVEAAAAIDGLPFFAFRDMPLSVEGREPPAPGNEPRSLVRTVTPGLFETLRIPLLQGRTITPQDTAQSPPVAVINAALARKLWPGGRPLLESLTILDRARLSRRIVGVVGDVRGDATPPDPYPVVYLPHAQNASLPSMGVMLRARGEAPELLDAVRAAVRSVDRNMPVYLARTLEAIVSDMDWQKRFTAILLGLFAALALGLAVTGIYAVLSYTVSQRARELGLRMALGAPPRQVVILVLRGAVGLVGLGIAAGLAGAAGLARALQSQLYRVEALDPSTYTAVSALLAAVAIGAALAPALRAARIDPIRALREE